MDSDARPALSNSQLQSPPRAVIDRYIVFIFFATVLISSGLLFWIQPLYGKLLLPTLGGAPSVWNTAMMLFQAVLLVGYAYAHFLTRLNSLRREILLHGLVLIVGLAFLPISIDRVGAPPPGANPIFWIVSLSLASIVWPFFALSASAPLLQSWFGKSRHPSSTDPYFLYAASNLGSLIALLTFPLVLEPMLTLDAQLKFWAATYILLLILLLCAAGLLWSAEPSHATDNPRTYAIIKDESTRAWHDRLFWICLAFVPSSLLLGVTTYITTDVASLPLFWVIPLSLYLITLVIAFKPRPLSIGPIASSAHAMGCILIFFCYLAGLNGALLAITVCIHLAVFFMTALFFHVELASRRPSVSRLTEFYLCLSLGGALGGVFNALFAPVLFSSFYEYYIVLIGACALRWFFRDSSTRLSWRDLTFPLFPVGAVLALLYFWTSMAWMGVAGRALYIIACAVVMYAFRHRPLRFALGFGGSMAALLIYFNTSDVLYVERSFFGIYRVIAAEHGRLLVFVHGTTNHGAEWQDSALQREPLSYHHRAGPIGQAFALLPPAHSVGVVGLGAGALACYRKPGQEWTFYEIDSAVERIARNSNFFHFLDDCGVGMKVVLGDGRLSLNDAADGKYDFLILDAFSSDAIPVHLLTVEALRLYLQKTADHGIVVFQISNRHFQLWPIVASLVKEVGVSARHQYYVPSTEERAAGAAESEWVVVGKRDQDLSALDVDQRWTGLVASQPERPWTDDFSNILSLIHFR
jgi:spermidine synthase